MGEIETHIRTYIDYVIAHPQAEDETILDALLKSGMAQYRIFELLIWVPMAFGRAVLERPELQLPATYQLMSADGQSFTHRSLVDEPVYVEALRLAAVLTREGFARNDFLAIAGRSSEFKAVNEALLNGSELKNLVASEPVISFPDDSLEPSSTAKQTKRPWWKLW